MGHPWNETAIRDILVRLSKDPQVKKLRVENGGPYTRGQLQRYLKTMRSKRGLIRTDPHFTDSLEGCTAILTEHGKNYLALILAPQNSGACTAIPGDAPQFLRGHETSSGTGPQTPPLPVEPLTYRGVHGFQFKIRVMQLGRTLDYLPEHVQMRNWVRHYRVGDEGRVFVQLVGQEGNQTIQVVVKTKGPDPEAVTLLCWKKAWAVKHILEKEYGADLDEPLHVGNPKHELTGQLADELVAAGFSGGGEGYWIDHTDQESAYRNNVHVKGTGEAKALADMATNIGHLKREIDALAEVPTLQRETLAAVRELAIVTRDSFDRLIGVIRENEQARSGQPNPAPAQVRETGETERAKKGPTGYHG